MAAPAKEQRRVGERVVVVGTSGSGKTTFAGNLAKIIGAPHIELDSLHWEPNWTEAELEVFRNRVRGALNEPRWVIDGNYSKVRDLIWPHADTIVWLDYELPVVMWRLAKRTFRRVFTQEELWSGNKEQLHIQLFTRDSIFWWAWTSHPRYRKEYAELFQQAEQRHLQIVQLKTPEQAQEWLGYNQARFP